MKTLLAGICTGLFVIACAGAPAQTQIQSPGDAGDLGEAALDQLCDPANEASLSALANRLYQFDPTTDTTVLQSQLDTVQANIEQLDLSPEQEPLGDAAAMGVGQLEVALADPQTAGGVANTAADSLVALDGAICLP